MSSTMVRPREVAPPVREPSTDFPTVEDEATCRRSRLRTAALVGVGGLVAGGAVGFVLGRLTGS
jgi:hypothetical protein